MKNKNIFLFLLTVFAIDVFAQADTSSEVSEKNPYGYLIHNNLTETNTTTTLEDKTASGKQASDTVFVGQKDWYDSYVFSNADSVDYRKNRISQGGIGYSKLQSEFLSPVTYGGITFRQTTTSERFIGNTMRRASMGCHFTTFQFSSTGNSINEFGAFVDYSYLAKVKHNINDNFRLYIGATSISEIVLDLKIDNTNNPFGYRFANTLDVSSLLYYRFKTKRYLAFTFFVDIPLIALISVPDYASSIPAELYENGSIAGAFSFKPIGQYTRLRTMVNLEFSFRKNTPVKSGSTWRLTYLFDGGNIKEPKKLGFSNQVLMVGRIFRIFNL